ncbi:adenine phosphoribosyltransferase [Candidatus Woesearchaeota archaeon]|nr:adenine phosphoribosyltransferase [Candidatus Woesearchaeota archaeon]
MEHLKQKIRTIPNFPKQGIMFRDITTLLKDSQGFQDVINAFKERYKSQKIDVVAGIEARGFIIGGALAKELGVGFVPLRKKGKLPHKVHRIEYDLEYGKDVLEIHQDAIKVGDRVLITDDLVATAGTCLAAADLVKKVGGEIAECCFVIELPGLHGREKLESKGYKVFSLVEFEGD